MKDSSKYLRYLVLGLGRSGTTAIHFALKGHPNVSALNDEVKISFFSEGISTFTQRDDNKTEKEAGFNMLFDSIAGVFANKETMAIGMKCVPADVDASVLLTKSIRKHFPDIKIILLNRKDLTAQYGSMLRAQATGEWHSWRQPETPSSKTVKINKHLFKKYITRSVLKYNELKTLSDSHDLLDVNYETCLLQKGGPDFSSIFDFLDLPSLPVTWQNCEKVSPPPEKYISNYELMKMKFLETISNGFSV